MRRFALIFGMLLTLTAGVWGSASAASAWCCLHEASAPSASDEHDCCRADDGEPVAHHSQSQGTSQDARHETSTTRNQSVETHARMDCRSANASSTPDNAPAALVQRGLSCAECCAGGSGRSPATAVVVAPEQNKVKRDAGSNSASDSFAPKPSRTSHLALAEHAPHAPSERRHILMGVFLI